MAEVIERVEYDSGGYAWREVQGPWQIEPDLVRWMYLGIECLVMRNSLGAWCGYVAVPADHPWYGVNYNRLYDQTRVHGGLTYSDTCDEMRPCSKCLPDAQFGLRGAYVDHAIRALIHEPATWWIGFDCGHYADLVPATLLSRRSVFGEHDTYRDLGYVLDETELLVRQLLDGEPVAEDEEEDEDEG